MKTLILYIDDVRKPPKEYKDAGYDVLVATSADKAIAALNQLSDMVFDKVYIDFDHDLGLGKTGYDIAKYIVENDIHIDGFSCHSMNRVGTYNIVHLLTHYGYNRYYSLIF